jgi:hypothetical protein
MSEHGSTDLLRVGEHGVEVDWGRLLRTEVSELSTDERFVAVSILDAGGKAFEKRLDQLKAQVRLDEASDLEAGTSKTVEHGGVKIQVTKKKTTVKVNEVALLALLSKKGLDPETLCFRQVLVLDSARLEQAVAGDVFSAEELRSFTTETESTPSVSVKGYAMGVTADRLLGGSK